MPQRVAVVTNTPSYHQVDLFNAVKRQGVLDTRVFYLRRITPGRQWKETRAIDHDHVFVPEIPMGRGTYRSKGLLRELRAFRPEVVVVTQYASTGMQAVMYACALTRTPWVFWSERPRVEFNEIATFKSDRVRNLAEFIATLPLRLRPRAIWGVGEPAVSAYSRRFGRPARNMPYVADLTRLLAIDRSQTRSGPLRFLFAGKLVERKGIDVLLDVIPQLEGEWTLHIVGDGPAKDAVASVAKRFPQRVRFTGFLEVAEMPSAFQSSDVLVAPSRYDGWGMVIEEAMAAGMPVIATRGMGASVDMVDHDHNGWLVSGGDSYSLIEAMRALIDRSHDVARAGVNARETALNYTADAGASRFADYLYQDVPSIVTKTTGL